MESREQSCWLGFTNVSLCFRQQLAQTFHYSQATNFAPEYQSDEDYRMIELMHGHFVAHLSVDSQDKKPDEMEYNARLSAGLVAALESICEHSKALRFRSMAKLARLVDCFFVVKRPAAGLKNLVETYYHGNLEAGSDPQQQIIKLLFRGEFDEIRKRLRSFPGFDLSKEFYRTLDVILPLERAQPHAPSLWRDSNLVFRSSVPGAV